jgi:signal transduction histidine kinase
MGGQLGRAAGETLRELKGSPAEFHRGAGGTIALAVGPVIAVFALVVALLGLVESQRGQSEAGVVSENPGGMVTSVSVIGFAWQDGIRPHQEVLSLRPVDEPGGWEIQTQDGRSGELFRSQEQTHTSALRGSWPLAAIGLLLAVAALASGTRRRMELFGALAIAATAIPIELRGQPSIVPVTSAAALLAPTWWLIRWSRMPRLAVVGVAGAVLLLLAAWTWAIGMNHEVYEPLDEVRQSVTIALAAGMLLAAPGMGRTPSLRSIRHLRGLDLAFGAGVVALIVVLQVMAIVPWFVSAIVAVGVVALYSRWRGIVVGSLDRLFLGDLRERASIDAIEAERSRVARDLHDEPLQHLAGVIKRLEARPENADVTGMLRSVADQLRGVATELHPPVLDDLGLAPSIEFLAARGPEGCQFTVAIAEETEYAASGRPPANVELAVFRIVQEAVANAVQHAGCSELVIEGSVSATRIDLRITDDGTGLTGREMNRAMRDGRLGLASMRRRAEAIDADLRIDGRRGKGTTVSVGWSA